MRSELDRRPKFELTVSPDWTDQERTNLRHRIGRQTENIIFEKAKLDKSSAEYKQLQQEFTRLNDLITDLRVNSAEQLEEMRDSYQEFMGYQTR